LTCIPVRRYDQQCPHYFVVPVKDSDKIDHALRTDLGTLKRVLHQFCMDQIPFIIKRWAV
jgi:hypothetical protein